MSLNSDAIQIPIEALDRATQVVDKVDASLQKLTAQQKDSTTASAESQRTNANVIGSFTELSSVLGLATAAWGAIKGQINESVAAAENAAVTEAKVQAVLAATGTQAGVSADQIDQWAASLSRSSGVEDETIKNAEAMALSFGNLSGQDIPRVTQAALDMSAVMGGDVNSSLLMISRVLETGVIPRGIAFSDTLKKQVKDAVDAGDQDKALAIILGELEKRYGGAAAKMNEASTKSQNLKNATENLREEWASGWLPVIRYLNEGLIGLAENLTASAKAANEQRNITKDAEAILEIQGLTMDNHRRVTLGLTMATQEQVNAAKEQALAIKDVGTAMTEAAPPAEILTGKYKDQLGLISSMQSAEDSYSSNSKKLADERVKLEEEKTRLLGQGYSEQSQQIQDINEKLGENSQASIDNAAQHDLDNKKIILGYLEQQLAIDGLTTTEMDALLKKGEQWGIYSDTVVTEAQRAQAEVEGYIRTLNEIPDQIHTNLRLTTTSGFDLGALAKVTGRDSGGPGQAGNIYLIGAGAQPEAFVAPSNGTFVPNADRVLGGGNAQRAFSYDANMPLLLRQLADEIARSTRSAIEKANIR